MDKGIIRKYQQKKTMNNNKEYRYQLESKKLTGHQHSCGYHYTPAEYFRDSLESYPPNTDLCDLALDGP